MRRKGVSYEPAKIRNPGPYRDLPSDDFRRTVPRFQGENFQKNLQLVDRITEMARQKGVTSAQLAIVWVLAQGSDIVPIPGTKRVRYVEQNAAAASIHLAPADLAYLDEVMPKGAAAGTRYAEPAMRMLGI